MSMLARYRVKEWNELIEGKELPNIKGVGAEINIIWKIEEYLTSTQSLFPNLIFNQLHGKQYYFYPEEPAYMSFAGSSPPRGWDWLL
jgi:hypothetical protein